VTKKIVLSVITIVIIILAHPLGVKAESSTDTDQTPKNSQEEIQKQKLLEQQKIQTAREKLQLELKAKREAFTTRVSQIKDQKKKELVQRIDNRITTVNTNRTTEMSRNLQLMSNLLAKLEVRVLLLSSDTSQAQAAIADAKEVIVKAREAVGIQTARTYTATITDDANLKTAVTATAKQFEVDIKATHQLVVSARQAIMGVIREVAKITKSESSQSSVSATGNL